jgi:hypothetical protein
LCAASERGETCRILYSVTVLLFLEVKGILGFYLESYRVTLVVVFLLHLQTPPQGHLCSLRQKQSIALRIGLTPPILRLVPT